MLTYTIDYFLNAYNYNHTNITIDGFFLGNEMGDAALAAINVAYPITAFVQALGTGIGMGGAVQYTIHKAQKKTEYIIVTV